MTCWPTRFEIHVWPTLSVPVTIGMATIPATSAVSRPVFLSGIAVSRTARSRNGEMIPSPAETRIRPSSASSGRRYGWKSLTTRPTGRGPVAPSGRPGSSTSRGPNALGNRSPGRCRLESQLQNFADRHDRMEAHLLAHVIGQLVQVGPVPLRQDHVGQAGRVSGEDLLLEATDRQHSPLQGDLAGHAD